MGVAAGREVADHGEHFGGVAAGAEDDEDVGGGGAWGGGGAAGGERVEDAELGEGLVGGLELCGRGGEHTKMVVVRRRRAARVRRRGVGSNAMVRWWAL